MFTPPPKKNLCTDPFDTTLVFGHFKAAGKPIETPDFFFYFSWSLWSNKLCLLDHKGTAGINQLTMVINTYIVGSTMPDSAGGNKAKCHSFHLEAWCAIRKKKLSKNNSPFQVAKQMKMSNAQFCPSLRFLQVFHLLWHPLFPISCCVECPTLNHPVRGNVTQADSALLSHPAFHTCSQLHMHLSSPSRQPPSFTLHISL